MAVPLYTFSIPIFINGLKMLSDILKEAREYAQEKNIDLSELVDAKLHPDMLPLSFQIQTASNTAKNSLVRIAGTTPVPMADDETTFEQLQDRLAKTIEILSPVVPEQLSGMETKDITFKVKHERHFSGDSYIASFALPNFFFHINMAYAILRSKGVPLGKGVYLGNFLGDAEAK